jgi:hypothetical protein
MDNAMKAAVAQYAELANMTEREVLEAMQSGDESVRNSVMMLMFAIA